MNMTILLPSITAAFIGGCYYFMTRFSKARNSAWIAGNLGAAVSCLLAAMATMSIAAKDLTQVTTARAIDAAENLEMLPPAVLRAAVPQAVAGWMGPVAKGEAWGCYKNNASLVHGWIPAKFRVHPDFTISISPRAPVSSGRSAGDERLYDAAGNALIAGCEAREAEAY